MCFTFFLFLLFSTYRPGIQGSISQAGRRGWHTVEGHNRQLDSGRCRQCHKCTAHILMAGKHTHTVTHLAWIIFLTACLKRGRHLPSIPCWILKLHTTISHCNSLVQEGNTLKKMYRFILKHLEHTSLVKPLASVTLILQINLCTVTRLNDREQQSRDLRFTHKQSWAAAHLCSSDTCVIDTSIIYDIGLLHII